VSPSHGDRWPQRKLFAVDHRLQQFTRSSFRGLALTDRDQHPDRQSVDPPIPFLPFPPMPDPGIEPRAPSADCLPIRHPFCSPDPDTLPKCALARSAVTLTVASLFHVPAPISDESNFDTPSAFWDARCAPVLCRGPQRHREGSTFCCKPVTVRPWTMAASRWR
jgi:hypothetical protein